jgi:PAS domain S-box-containing protein
MAEDVDAGLLRRRLADLQALAGIGFFEFDLATEALWWSPELFYLYGVDAESFTPTMTGWLSLLHPDDRSRVRAAVEQTIVEGVPFRLDHRFLSGRDGTLRWTRCAGHVLAGPDGSPARISGAALDITEQHRSTDRFRDLISSAAHDLRSPAAAIQQSIYALERGLGPDDYTTVLDILKRQAARLTQLTTDLIDLGRIGAEHAQPEAVEVAEAVAEAAEVAPPPEGRHLDLSGIPAGLTVRAVRSDLERILVNLLTNAWRYGGPHVEVSARADDQRVIVEVADDGAGVPEEQRADLFQPFHRGPQRHPEASGLGLAIVEGLMRHVGGSVHYRPGDPGAVFVLSFEER